MACSTIGIEMVQRFYFLINVVVVVEVVFHFAIWELIQWDLHGIGLDYNCDLLKTCTSLNVSVCRRKCEFSCWKATVSEQQPKKPAKE